MFKLNFDGASKGNPILACYGYIVWDNIGNLRGFNFVFIGWETNNAVETEGLLQGIEMLKENRWMPIIIEGYSQEVIRRETKLQNGTHSAKVVRLWHLEGRVENLKGSWLRGWFPPFTMFGDRGIRWQISWKKWVRKHVELSNLKNGVR